MDRNLANELLQLQQSRCGLKYAELVDDYVKEIPERVIKSINRPINSINKRFSIYARFHGRMLYNLEKKFYKSLKRLRNYSINTIPDQQKIILLIRTGQTHHKLISFSRY